MTPLEQLTLQLVLLSDWSIMKSTLMLALILASCGTPKPDKADGPDMELYRVKVLAHVLVEAHTFLYNQNVAGKSQNVSTTVFCPQGGEVTITGNAHEDLATGITSANLKYESLSCRLILTDHDVTMTGVMQEKGTFNSDTVTVSSGSVTTGMTSLTYISTLAFVSEGEDNSNSIKTTLHSVCPVTLVQSGNKVSGTVCEKVF